MAASGAGNSKGKAGGNDAAQERAAMQTMNEGTVEVEIDEAKVMSELQELLKDVHVAELDRQMLEQALRSIKVKDADIETVATEFELTKATARRKIREAGGDAALALQRLMGIAEDDKGQAILRRVKRFQELMAEAKSSGMDEKAAMAEASKRLAEEGKKAGGGAASAATGS